ncbi:recombinase family protein, partial [Escherichia coli 95.1288]
LKTRKMLMKL